MGVRAVVVVGLVCAALGGGCIEEHAAPPPAATPARPTAIPAYDGSQRPAKAVQALVPLRATTLRVVDLRQIRRQVGLPGLTSRSSAGERAEFRARAAVAAPLLDPLVLAPVDHELRAGYGFGVDDEEWEAHFSGGGSRGWVVELAPDVAMAAVTRAVRAGIGPLRGATVDAAARLVTEGVAAPGRPVWGSDPTWARLVPAPGEAFLVHRGCLETPSPQVDPALEPISGFAVTFGDHVATVRVDRDRSDLFARRRGGGGFARVFRNGVADPSSGRIGYDVPHPALAVRLVRKGDLPFGACAAED